jgi:NAD(P)-dependent dehydrogenase (short-subunit alcohol dehydrogenase family)
MGEILKGKVAVVTGSGQGVGYAIASAMAQEGAKVVTNNRKAGTPGGDAETAAEAIRKAGGEAVACFADASVWAEGEKLINTAVENFGGIDILVNNAGADVPRMIFNMSEDEWDRCVDSLLKSAFVCTRHASPIMRERKWGRILNVTSHAFVGTVGHANYGAAKGGLVSFTYAVARELGRSGVTCNAIAPTAATRMTVNEGVRAGMQKRLDAGLITPEQYEEYVNPPPLETVPPIFTYLASDEGADINGKVFRIERGRLSIYADAHEEKSVFRMSGVWSQEELKALIPRTLLIGYVNPAPAEKPK